MKFCNRSISCTQAEKRASIALSMHNNNYNGENWNNLISVRAGSCGDERGRVRTISLHAGRGAGAVEMTNGGVHGRSKEIGCIKFIIKMNLQPSGRLTSSITNMVTFFIRP